jgi:hypothetical protein
MRVLTLALVLLCSCSTAYYAGLEKLGIPKRDLLEKRVEKARDAQVDVTKQFGSALERFRATVQVNGGALEERYDAMNAELASCESRADALRERIEAVEDVAEALFEEWENELREYQRTDLRQASARQLAATRARYRPMIAAMKRAHQRVEPVLGSLRDVVLAMKHQLNAKAISGVKEELASVEHEVGALLAAMNISIAQATEFLNSSDAGKNDQSALAPRLRRQIAPAL